MPKNVALILAGGLGSRMGMALEVPKQFYRLIDKPLLVHTLGIFDSHAAIDAVCVVCLETWETYLKECLDEFGVKKVRWIVSGGETRHASVHNGLKAVADYCADEDIIVVHDGVRPFIGDDIIFANILAAREYGSAMTSIQSGDSLLVSPDRRDSGAALARDSVFLVQTPQSYPYARGRDAYLEAERRGMPPAINCCELFISLGQAVHLVPGLKTNIKLTTAEDIHFLHALHEIYRREGRLEAPVGEGDAHAWNG